MIVCVWWLIALLLYVGVLCLFGFGRAFACYALFLLIVWCLLLLFGICFVSLISLVGCFMVCGFLAEFGV